jgi:hypothetical protein
MGQQRGRRWELREEARRFLYQAEGKKGRASRGAIPSGLKRGGGGEGSGRRAHGVGAPVGSGAPPVEAGGGQAPWPEQGRKWGAIKWAPELRARRR